MSLVVFYQIDAPLFEEVFAAVPDASLQVEQAVALCATSTLLTVRATTGADEGNEALDAALERDRTVADTTVLDTDSEGERVYRIEVPTSETTYREWVEAGGVLLDATATEAGWNIRMRFPDREALAVYRTRCSDRGIEFALRSVRDTTGSTSAHPYGLTVPQYEMLTAALAKGYFEIPREVRMSDLACELGISDQAASERLRRALSRLLGSLAVEEYYR